MGCVVLVLTFLACNVLSLDRDSRDMHNLSMAQPTSSKYKKQYPIGSVSCGTMRAEDLIPSFLYEAKQHRLSKANRAEIRRIEAAAKVEGYYDTEEASFDLNESLFDILESVAGPFFYFGSHPGDGADYGFWLSEEWEERLEEDGGIKVSDLSEVPAGHVGYVAVVNDHGNVTLYTRLRNGRLREEWAIV